MTEENMEYADLTPRQVTELLDPYDKARARAKDANEAQKLLADTIRGWLVAHPEHISILDLEHGIEAVLQWRRSGDVYNVAGMPDDLVLALAGLGCLVVDQKAIVALGTKMAAAVRAREYKMPPVTAIAALIVREIREEVMPHAD